MVYAAKLFFDEKETSVFMNATGAATPNAVRIIEELRNNVQDLHVCYQIKSTEFIDEYEPLEEGLDRVVDVRTISTLSAVLTISDADSIRG